ncbi:MAG: protein-disulfide reductase DsbD domain-containing protein [Acetobacteraceae bacterium]
MGRSLAARFLARAVSQVVGFAAMAAATIVLLPGPAQAAASGWVGDRHAAVRLVTAEQATGSARMVDAGLEIRLAPGWHAYWRDPGAAGLPTSIDWHGSRNLTAAKMDWPAPRRFAIAGLQSYGYASRVVLPIAASVQRPGAPLMLHATVAYSACSNICIPYHAALTLALPAGMAVPGPEAPLIAAARAKVPGTLSSLGLSLRSVTVWPDAKGKAEIAVTLAGNSAIASHPDLFVEGLPEGAPGPPEFVSANGVSAQGTGHARLLLTDLDSTAPALAGRNLVFTLTDGPDRAATFHAAPALAAPSALPNAALIPLTIVAVALLGGLLLNVMPCVLPVISLKLVSIARLAGVGRRTVRRELFATAAGIVAGFLALAAGLIGLKEVGALIGWGIQFQNPWFLIAMTMVMVVFAADLWGLTTIWLPGGTAAAAATERVSGRYAKAFLVGIFATLLSTSCSAPFIGTAVGFALSRGPIEILAIFLAMGLGLAAPMLAVAAAPQLIGLIPRPGQWMIWLSRVFGALLLATSIWLLTVLARVSGTGAAVIVGVLALLLLALLAWRRYARGRGAGGRDIASGAAAVLVLAALLVPLRAWNIRPSMAVDPAGIWHPFAPAAIAANVAKGRTVLVNVTAAWCLICKVNEVTVLDRNPVAARIARPEVLAMRADWTRPDPAITGYLESFGRYGVPLDVVYGPAAPSGIVLPDLVTAPEVIRALDRAGGRSRAAER